MNEINLIQQGLEYLKCGAVMAPHVSYCVNYRRNKSGGTATTTIGVATDYNFKVVPQSTTGETDMLPKHTETAVEQWK